MRWSEFKKISQLNENAEFSIQKTFKELDTISKVSAELPADDPVKVKLPGQIQAVANAMKNFVAQLAGKYNIQTNESITEDADPVQGELDAAIAQLKTQESLIQKYYHMYTPEDKKIADDGLQSMEAKVKSLQDAVIKESQSKKQIQDELTKTKEELEKTQNFLRQVNKDLITLGNRVQGYQIITDEDLAAMPSSERSGAKSTRKNAEKFTKNLRQALFGKINDVVEESDSSQEDVANFLSACVRGEVINMLNLVGAKRGNVRNFVNPDYLDVFKAMEAQGIFEWNPGSTGGAIGPGEMALAMMGNPAEKAKVGDIKVGKIMYEVKAGRSGSGGRMNSKALAKASTGWLVWEKRIAEIMKSGAPDDEELYGTPKHLFNGNIVSNKGKRGSKYNWNPTGLELLNQEILPYADYTQASNLFIDSLKALVQNHKKVKNFDDRIRSAITMEKIMVRRKGDEKAVEHSVPQINVPEMLKNYGTICYDSYNIADKVKHILFLRIDTLDFTIIENAKDLARKMTGTEENPATVKLASGFNWNDDQQNPTSTFIAT